MKLASFCWGVVAGLLMGLLLLSFGCQSNGTNATNVVTIPPLPALPAVIARAQVPMVKPAMTSTNATYKLEAYFSPGYAGTAFFTCSTDMVNWQVLNIFPYPTNGGTLILNIVTNGNVRFFRAGWAP